VNKKEQFILMAKQGLPKPQGNSVRMFSYYTSKASKAYDPDFTQVIQKLAPHWLEHKKKQETKKFKTVLLKLAYEGKEKPKEKVLKDAFWRYTCPTSKIFDPDFVHELKIVAPNWLLIRSTSPRKSCFEQEKQELLKLAQANVQRPSKAKSQYGKWIWRLTSPKSNNYDEAFAQKLKTLVPHWFVFPKREDKIKGKKEKVERLLNMAKANEPRPKRGTKEERVLRSYCDSKDSAYDPVFLDQLKKINPNWIPASHGEQRDQTKKQLLDLAASGAKKPTYRQSYLAKRFSDFTNRYSRFYDAEFTQVIKNLNPNWFVDPIENAKQLIVQMAQDGKPKPVVKRKTIGWKFHRWTNPKSRWFDRKLYDQLKSIRPDWFLSSSYKKKETLFNLAAQKMPRPKDSLAHCLNAYTQKSSKCYDQYFTKEIKLLAPHWFRK
jgi:hypothetical protein